MNSKFNYFFFDMYSKRAGFFFNNSEKIGSLFGLSLSFIYIIISIVMLINILITTIQRKEVKVYDTSINAQEMPQINIDSNNLYFAFGMEDPKSLLRYIDETIYYPKILFIDRLKINGKFETISKKTLQYERCIKENFGQNYQHFFTSGELNNSYCLKDFNYNLTFAGGYKYDRMSYIRILVYPCKNTTDNKNHCKSREIIDNYLTNGYFSVLIKDFGLNPSNFSFPVLPSLQDIYTTTDRRILRNFYIKFGLTEIHTDINLINEKIEKAKYLQYRNNFQTFQFREEKDYLNGKEFCITHLELEDSIIIQKRTYTKLSEVFSKIGGYMQLMNTAFSLLVLLISKFNTEMKLINSIFHFNIQEKKMGLKFKSLDHESVNHLTSNKNLIFSSRNSIKNIEFNNNLNINKSKNQLNIMDNSSNMSSVLNASYNNNKNAINIVNAPLSKGGMTPKNRSNIKNNGFFLGSVKSNEFFPKAQINNGYNGGVKLKTNTTIFKEDIKLNLFDILCYTKNSKKKKDIELFKLGNSFYRKRMDIVHVFTLLIITEKVLIKNNEKIMIYCS